MRSSCLVCADLSRPLRSSALSIGVTNDDVPSVKYARDPAQNCENAVDKKGATAASAKEDGDWWSENGYQ